MMVTYDTIQQKCRVWRFETLPPAPDETTLRTKGIDINLEIQVTPMKEGGPPEIFYNRYRMISKNRMKIVSEVHSLDRKVIEGIGVSEATRIKKGFQKKL